MRFNNITSIFMAGLLLPLSACGVDSGSAHDGVYKKPADWQTVCVDRLLVDLPAMAQMGATGAKYRGGVGFDGIEDAGWIGLQWGGVEIFETFPTNLAGYTHVKDGANGEVSRGIFGYNEGIEGLPIHIKGYKKRLDQAESSEGKQSWQDIIDDEVKNLESCRVAVKVSGEAKIPYRYGFAYRLSNKYSIGYFDAVDQRVRLFVGAVQNPALGVEAAAQEYQRFQRIYHRRAPTDIPTGPGYCTGYGFLDEPADKPETNTEFELPFRSLKYPNLVFILDVHPAYTTGPRDIKKLDNPNEITAKDIKGMTGMGAVGALMGLANIKRSFGPEYLDIAGQPGRLIGREYHRDASSGEGGGDMGAVYEFEAEVLGEPGRLDRPAIKLQMAAALPDKDPLPPGVKPTRPVLKGHQPPPVEEGLKLFKQVLESLRLRPVTALVTPVATASAPKP